MLKQRVDLTFKHNLKQGRHGWLRLTPAYSVKVVQEILDHARSPHHALDPFCGTGTTGLVCAERGISCDLVEINPFLAWFARAKTRNYSLEEITATEKFAQHIVATAKGTERTTDEFWIPPIHNIKRWWTPGRLTTLSQIFDALQHIRSEAQEPVADLLLISFCRLIMDWSNAAFNHQSMSFKSTSPSLFDEDERGLIFNDFLRLTQTVVKGAWSNLTGEAKILAGDSREISATTKGPYDLVITSPPYPNRMSYIRELRPYMYWLGYLADGRGAGELDWQAIGGTWGIATSRLQQWSANGIAIQHEGFENIIQRISENSPLLARYVHKYFIDIAQHLFGLKSVLAPSAQVYYIVGNSKFYNVLVPVEHIYASLLAQAGFRYIQIETLRKRNSKKELVEYCVKAEL